MLTVNPIHFPNFFQNNSFVRSCPYSLPSISFALHQVDVEKHIQHNAVLKRS